MLAKSLLTCISFTHLAPDTERYCIPMKPAIPSRWMVGPSLGRYPCLRATLRTCSRDGSGGGRTSHRSDQRRLAWNQQNFVRRFKSAVAFCPEYSPFFGGMLKSNSRRRLPTVKAGQSVLSGVGPTRHHKQPHASAVALGQQPCLCASSRWCHQ